MKPRVIVFLLILALGVACGSDTTPTAPTTAPNSVAPTADVRATETTVAQRIFATLTASAPQAATSMPLEQPTSVPTVTPPPAPNVAATAPVVPTLSAALSPSVTPLPVLPTRVPPAVPSAAPTQAPLQVTEEGLRGMILFKSTRNGGKYPNSPRYFVMNADGTDVRQVNSNEATKLYDALKPYEGYSPDRKLLVVGEVQCPSNAHCNLYIGEPDVVINRSQGPWISGPPYARADNPVWSPNGDSVIFVWNNTPGRTKNIFKGNPYISNQDFKKLTDFGGQKDTKDPTFSPDGSQLAFATQDGPHWQIWVLNPNADTAAEANAHNLSPSDYDDWDPLWVK